MSMDHRRPLYAFLAVFVVAVLVVANAARSDAFRQYLRERTVEVVAASVLHPEGPTSRTVALEPVLATPEAGPEQTAPDAATTNGPARKAGSVRHHRPAHGQQATGSRHHRPTTHGHAKRHATHHGTGKARHGKTQAGKHRPGHARHHAQRAHQHGKHHRHHARHGH